MAPLEQGCAQRGFQLLDLAADRRLGQEEFFGREREAERARCRLERRQQRQAQLRRTRLHGRLTHGFDIPRMHATYSESSFER